MTAVNVKVRITVDPAGRVLVWEREQSLPSDLSPHDAENLSGAWHKRPGCRTYILDVDVPVPPLDAPRARVVTNFDGTPKVDEGP